MKYKFSIFIIGIILTTVLFWNISAEKFLFLHDEVLVLSKYDPSGSLFIHNPTDLGTANTAILIATLFDRLYYLITSHFDLELLTSQKLLYFLKITISVLLPYLGFKRILKLFSKKIPDNLTAFTVALWYAFNTYTIIYWHGNNFSLTLLMCYALAPLAFYYYHQSIFNKNVKTTDSATLHLWLPATATNPSDSTRFASSLHLQTSPEAFSAVAVNVKDRFLAILILFLMSFALYLFPVFLIIILIHTFLFSFLKKMPFSILVKNLAILSFLYFPLIFIHLLIPYDMFTSGVKTVNITGGETYGNLQGGLLYPLLMWFSWGIYTIWEPRNIFTFYKYFKTIPAIIAPFTLYALVIYDFVKGNKNAIKKIFLFSLLILLLLIKGPQPPFGEIYLYLIENVGVFRIFRSPDNKFGFGIVFLLANLLLLASRSYKRWIFILIISIIILIQGQLFFSGRAVKGENTKTSSDRIISIGKEYHEYINFVNEQGGKYGYIVTIPPIAFANYNLGENESHWGQDLLPKLTKFPYIYIDENGGMTTTIYNKISSAVENGDLNILVSFPIRFFIIRSDIKNYDYNLYQNAKTAISNNFEKVFKNEFFEVFENKNALPIIQPDGTKFTMVSPVEYNISFKNLKETKNLQFLQSFNQNWKLYPKSKTMNIMYLFKKPILEKTHSLKNDHANSWDISKDEIQKNWEPDYYKINQDGSIDFNLTLYLKTQAVFYMGALVSGLYFLIITVILVIIKLNQKTTNHYDK